MCPVYRAGRNPGNSWLAGRPRHLARLCSRRQYRNRLFRRNAALTCTCGPHLHGRRRVATSRIRVASPRRSMKQVRAHTPGCPWLTPCSHSARAYRRDRSTFVQFFRRVDGRGQSRRRWSAMDHEEERSVSLGTEVSASVPPPSPLTGCYLLAVVGEPHTHEHKEIILQRLVKGKFLSRIIAGKICMIVPVQPVQCQVKSTRMFAFGDVNRLPTLPVSLFWNFFFGITSLVRLRWFMM